MKIYLFLIFLVSCNPFTSYMRINIKPANVLTPTPQAFKKSDGAKISAAAGFGRGSQVSADMELSPLSETVVKGTAHRMDVHINTTTIR